MVFSFYKKEIKINETGKMKKSLKHLKKILIDCTFGQFKTMQCDVAFFNLFALNLLNFFEFFSFIFIWSFNARQCHAYHLLSLHEFQQIKIKMQKWTQWNDEMMYA